MVTQLEVDQALDTAVLENGYESLKDLTWEEVAIDLTTFSQDFESADPHDLKPLILSWLERHK